MLSQGVRLCLRWSGHRARTHVASLVWREMNEKKDSEILLIERACIYLTKGEYPPSVNKNEKRSIRRKAGKLCVIQGEIFYLHKDGQKVCAAIDIGLYHFQELHGLICMVQYCIYLIGGGKHF